MVFVGMCWYLLVFWKATIECAAADPQALLNNRLPVCLQLHLITLVFSFFAKNVFNEIPITPLE